MKYTKDEEEKAERSSVKMWPGITAGIIIGLIAFVLSFDALRLVFVACGINPWLSWGGPVCVDGTILLCTWATWGFKKGHIRGSAYPWIGLVLFSGFSITGNALHAMINTGFQLPSWVPPVIMSIPPVALLYATHLIVIIAGDRLDKINTVTPTINATRVPEPTPRESRVPVEPAEAQPMPPAPVPLPAPVPVVETKTEPEPEPMIPDLFDFQTIVPNMEDDADPKAEEAEAPAADASTPTITTSDSNIPQPVMESHVTIPTLVETSTATPDIPTETTPTPEPEAEPVENTTPSEAPVTAVETEKESDPQAEQAETEAGNEPVTDDAVKTKPKKKTRRNKAGADDEEWLAWLDELKAQNETPTSAKAVEAGLASSNSTAKRYLARIRKEHPERF